MKFDILEYDKLGDIVLNLIFGAKSAAKEILNPFRALFAEDMAVWFLKPFKQTSVQEFANVMNSNFFNVANFLHNCIDKFSDNSSVVFFSSIAASRGFKNHTAISSAKSALKGLSISLAADFAPKIRFNTISPSLSYSKMSNFITSNEKVAEGLGKLHPMSRLGNGDDIAELAVFLISNQSSWITGQNFNVDGGRSTLFTK